MQISKLKTIAIILLLLVNGCFLAIIAYNYLQQFGAEHRENENLTLFASENGIEFSAQGSEKSRKLPILFLKRDYDMEKSMAEALFGKVEFEDQGGDISYYYNELGHLRFRGNGNFELVFEDAVFSQEGLKELLGKFPAKIKQTYESSEKLEYICMIGDEPVFDCVLHFEFENGALHTGGGKFIMRAAESELTSLNKETALVRFISSLKVSGDVCRRIDSMHEGYLYSTGEFLSLVPCWQIVTDTAKYYVTAPDAEVIKENKENF